MGENKKELKKKALIVSGKKLQKIEVVKIEVIFSNFFQLKEEEENSFWSFGKKENFPPFIDNALNIARNDNMFI